MALLPACTYPTSAGSVERITRERSLSLARRSLQSYQSGKGATLAAIVYRAVLALFSIALLGVAIRASSSVERRGRPSRGPRSPLSQDG
ncbi:MAG TPA: hypothetical protein VKV26_10975 [Dehalococcoidia bacterium]|nr:hypothetical protein [Dehalococcoidia bacterium]